ncbi:calmodulin-binding transcription activator 1 isoform X15 [Sciurus carolinensis]|uniref:calmodulin-binding transcription activator 1 isoform X15 n=1 Tax=Sciurus carolinensis TaxID=30640 RepID=UPI001FB39E6B|nr:calmodulin-binding transcription activator 1 isoform X15 [Sciurus carolinensis]
MWRAEGKWLPKTSRKSVSQSVFCGTSTYCVLNTVPPIEDDHGNSNSSHVKIFLPKKLLECLPKCSSLPKERHRWNTNELHLGCQGKQRDQLGYCCELTVIMRS